MASTRAGANGSFQPDYITIPYAVLTDSNLSPTAKLVYGRLKLYAGKSGHACPKHETLALEVCLKKRQLQYMLTQLEDAGWISSDRARTNCIYTVYSERQKIATLVTAESSNKLPPRVAENCLKGAGDGCELTTTPKPDLFKGNNQPKTEPGAGRS
jgi:hypothetical protein